MTAPTGGFVVGGVILLLLVVLGFGAFLWRAYRLYRYMRLGRDEARIDHPWRRVRDELIVYLGQRKLLKRPYYVRGLAHAFIFWGFLIITIGTVDLLIDGIFGFHVPGAGSAIFFHIRRGLNRPTSGCTTMAEGDLVRLIAWLRADSHPCYALLPAAEYQKKWRLWNLPEPEKATIK